MSDGGKQKYGYDAVSDGEKSEKHTDPTVGSVLEIVNGTHLVRVCSSICPWQGRDCVANTRLDMGNRNTCAHVHGVDATDAILRLLVCACIALTISDSPPLDVGQDPPARRL